MDDERLDAIRARSARATAGPWRHYTDGLPDDVRVCQEGAATGPGDGRGCVCCLALMGDAYDDENDEWSAADLARWVADADFIAAAREDVPWLLAEVDRLRAERRDTVDEALARQRQGPEVEEDAMSQVRCPRCRGTGDGDGDPRPACCWCDGAGCVDGCAVEGCDRASEQTCEVCGEGLCARHSKEVLGLRVCFSCEVGLGEGPGALRGAW